MSHVSGVVELVDMSTACQWYFYHRHKIRRDVLEFVSTLLLTWIIDQIKSKSFRYQTAEIVVQCHLTPLDTTWPFDHLQIGHLTPIWEDMVSHYLKLESNLLYLYPKDRLELEHVLFISPSFNMEDSMWMLKGLDSKVEVVLPTP